jgi:hypothetical protein
MPDEEEWFENIGGCQPITSVFIATNWGNIALGGFIFLHSFYIHRLKYSKIRLLTEACAFGGILTGIFHLACKVVLRNAVINKYLLQHVISIDATNPEDKEYCGIIGNFLVSGVANIFVQLPDNLISLFTYIALNTAGRARKYMRTWEATITALYIIFVLFLPFIAPVTFIPLIVNENTDDYNTKVGLPLMFAYTYGYVLYNTYFTAAFCLVLYKIRFDKKSFYPPIAKEICIKCVAHFFIR